MRLATAADQLEPDHHMTEYLAHAHDSLSRAWYLQPGEVVPPHMQRWHARSLGLGAAWRRCTAKHQLSLRSGTARAPTQSRRCRMSISTLPALQLRTRGAFRDALDH
jgi:hypothetical protein